MKSPRKLGGSFLTLGTVAVAIFLSFPANYLSAACVSPPSGLVGWWRGEANALDQTGTNNGALTGNATFGPGRVNQAFVFDGVTGSFNVPASASLNVGTGEGFTVEAWIKPDDIANAQPLAEWFQGSGSPWGVHFWISETGSGPGPGCLYVNVMDLSGGEHKFASAAGLVGTNLWQHVAVTYDKTTGLARMFYNGAVVAEQFLGSYTPQTSYPLYLGNRPAGTFSGTRYHGAMDEIAIYNRALSTNEIHAIYIADSAGKCLPPPPPSCTPSPAGLVSWWRGEANTLDQAGTNNGTLAGNTTYGSGLVGQGFVFDGNTDFVAVGNPTNLQLQDFTIETWIKRGSSSVVSSGSGGNGLIFGYGYGGYGLFMDANGKPGLSKIGISGVNPVVAITDTNLHHVAVTKSGSIVAFYVDGVLYSAAAYDPGFSFSTVAAIGARGDNLDNSFLGVIDEVSVYSRALATNEIQAIFNAGSFGKCVAVSPPPCAPAPSGLVGWWRGESSALDQMGTNNGTLVGNTTYVAGRVGQGFAFDGSGDAVSLGNPASLQLQDFTIEAWIKRASSTVASFDFNGGGILSYGGGGYSFGILDNGKLFLSRVEVDAVFPSAAITDTNLHHVAVTKLGTNVVFYVDGTAYSVPPYYTSYNFATPAAIGARGDNSANSFFGTIDELSVYNRQLSAGEIEAIYSAGDYGKCLPGTKPLITSQPATQTLTVGDTATFNVTASGTATLSYQWRLNSTNIAGATTDSLVLTNVQLTNAGLYSVVVSNLFGADISSNATLTVNALVGCVTPPAGLVSWWRGEANSTDQIGTNNGVIVGNTTYGAGRVGQGFIFDGSRDAVSIGNPASLQLQDFTIETWIKRASATIASFDFNGGEIFGYGGGGYVLGMLDNGTPFLSRVEVDAVFATTAITDTNLHHLAVTKSGTNVVFYVDGVAYFVPPYNTTFNFATPSAIGARGDTLANSFFGTIDELSVYNRQLSSGEIQSIYNAGENGKCVPVVPPLITSHPATQTATVGETATFNVVASGTAPLAYQWRLNSTNIVGATADSLVLTNVQLTNAGLYSVVVSNTVGTATSSNAILTINTLAGCGTPPAGLVSWWRGEGNALDQVGANNGTLVGNTTYGAGSVSQAFVFDGSGDGVSVGNPASLQLQDFTIEAWIKRASTLQASLDAGGGEIFGYGYGGFVLGILDNGTLFLSRVGIDNVKPNTVITDTDLHHVAVTKVGTNVVFYVDGVAFLVPPYNTSYTFDAPAAIGARGDTLANSFLGSIDEVSVYNRSLSASEILGIYNAGSSGKCLTPIPAFIIRQPADAAGLVGGNAAFSVTAGGTAPFSYQWRFSGASITNATNATLTLANVQPSQAGNYSVAVGNVASPTPVLSSNATLTLTYPAAKVRVVGTNIVSGRPVTLPIEVVANGNENALSFSLNYSTARLTFNNAQLGAYPPGTYFFVNTSQTNVGRLGVTVALPSGATFAPGTQLLAGVTFDATIWLSVSPTATTVSFGDQPMVRGLTDVNALTLAATYTSGQVVLSGTDLEGDSIPRPGGSRSFTVNDWVQAGRFAAKLDIPAAGGEFQRADAAPRGTFGDGQVSVMDWVQAGRYFAGLDPLTAVGGPTVEAAPTGPLGPDPLRAVRVTATNAILDVAVIVPVSLQAQGNENGVGFTVSFDPAALSYLTASLGSGAAGANFNLNTNQVASGKLGLALVLPTGSSFTAGPRELVQVSLRPTSVGSYPVTLSDQLVLRGVSDPAAIELPASYVTGTVVVNPHPTLLITRVGTNVALSWPALASGFNLQSSTNAMVPGGWGDVLATPQPEGDNLKVTLPVTDQTEYFRLRHP